MEEGGGVGLKGSLLLSMETDLCERRVCSTVLSPSIRRSGVVDTSFRVPLFATTLLPKSQFLVAIDLALCGVVE